jgi:gluconolactonase
MVSILRDAGLSRLIASDSVELIASGLVFTEGPLELGDGSLLFEDVKASKTYRLNPDGSLDLLRDNTRGANGQTFGADGSIYFCEQDGRRISKMNSDGSNVQTVVETWQGGHLNSPNDIVGRGVNRWLYFTDPPYGVPAADRTLHFQGVYGLDPQHNLHLILDDFEKPNGLAFSPDEKTLYVCDTARYHVRAFDMDSQGKVVAGSGRVFSRQDPGKNGGPDGMKVDADGRVYVAVALGVWVYEPDGKLLGILDLPERPSNLAWRNDGKTLAITAVDKVYQVRFNIEGWLPPLRPW